MEVLRRIKLLRKLGLPLEEIRQMQHGASIVMSVLMAGLIWLFLWAFEVDPAGAPPLPVLALFVAIPAAVVVGVVIALVQRVREIERGEEDDARNY
uniref:hypothetical protein n=1 Tax=Dysosmobacter welbionis TaxID=2093857 RepID=UPI002FE20EA0